MAAALLLAGAFGFCLVLCGWALETSPERWGEYWRYRVERVRWQHRAFRCRAEGDEHGRAIASHILDTLDMRWRWR